jgi:hypothetical protein
LQVTAGDLPRRGRRQETALAIALRRGDHSLALLLLANGYDSNQEGGSPLDQALRDRRWDMLDLLLDWGANPNDVDLEALFDTYQTSLFDRFKDLGVDLTGGHALACALGYHTSNKPLFGFARRNRVNDPRYQAELNIALAHHAGEGNEKGVMLCLWAGADPHAPALSLRYDVHGAAGEEECDLEDLGTSAVWQTCASGHHQILDRLKPDPQLDDFDSLYRVARDSNTIQVLFRIEAPHHPGDVIHSLINEARLRSSLERWGGLGYGDHEAVRALETLFESGVRWHVADGEEASGIRALLIKLPDAAFVSFTKLLALKDYCSPEILREIGRTPAMRKRMKEVGFIPPDEKDPKRWRYDPPTRSREVLSKYGIERAEPPPSERPLPAIVWIGQRRPGTVEQRMTRQELFERVWSRPVETVAAEWGISGRGLSKACRRLKLPVPPRGYWARLQAGQRPKRPRLPAVKAGDTERIIVWGLPGSVPA